MDGHLVAKPPVFLKRRDGRLRVRDLAVEATLCASRCRPPFNPRHRAPDQASTADFSNVADWLEAAQNCPPLGKVAPQVPGPAVGRRLHGGDSFLQFVDNSTSEPGYIRRQMDRSSGVNPLQPDRLTLSFRYDRLEREDRRVCFRYPLAE